MMNFHGERFHIPLGDDEDEYDAFEKSAVKSKPQAVSIDSPFGDFVKDVQERSSTAKIPPVAPSLKDVPHGFPAHKKRTGVSRFKKSRVGQSNTAEIKPTPIPSPTGDQQNGRPGASFEDREREKIDKENNERLAGMSEEAIASERADLLKNLSPSLIERLLRRANINTDTGPANYPQVSATHSAGELQNAERGNRTGNTSTPETRQKTSKLPPKRVAFDVSPTEPAVSNTAETPDSDADDAAENPSNAELPAPPPVHFPRPPSIPDLDPSSGSFLTDLHEKYFPDLPSDPSKLAWMTDATNLPDYESTYSPESDALPPSALRFSFRGKLIPPRTALAIPVTAGLHHHGEAPESAGYTIPELAHLARSSFAAQRCVAFQSLGRIMFRLGKGEFGDERSDLNMGLWKVIEEGKVLKTLQEEVGKKGGHLSSKAYATEALWLWQKGGGKVLRAQ